MMMLMQHNDLGLYIVMGLLASLSCTVILWRTGHMRKALGYPVLLDVTVLIIMVWMLHSSILGTLIGIVGALIFSATIGLLRFVCGYERLVRREDGWRWVSCRQPFMLSSKRVEAFKTGFARWAA